MLANRRVSKLDSSIVKLGLSQQFKCKLRNLPNNKADGIRHNSQRMEAITAL